LVSRGLAPTVPRPFIVDGAKALSKAIRRTFGSAAAIQRCQIHKARNIMERLPKEHHAATRRVLRQAWELDDADKAEKLIRNLARRLDQQWPGVAASILEGLDEILTVVRLKLPKELRRSLAYQHRREHDGHHSPRHPQRQTLAGCRYGLAMGRGRHDRGQQGLPTIEGA
jgi:transposase-like protein